MKDSLPTPGGGATSHSAEDFVSCKIVVSQSFSCYCSIVFAYNFPAGLLIRFQSITEPSLFLIVFNQFGIYLCHSYNIELRILLCIICGVLP